MKNKMAVAFMLVILALSVAGSSYAVWTSSVTFSGTASTGNINLIIKSIVQDDTSDYVTFASSIAGDQKSATIDLGNLYPGAEVSFIVRTRNTGLNIIRSK